MQHAYEVYLRQQIADRRVHAIVGGRDTVCGGDRSGTGVHGEADRLFFRRWQSTDQRDFAQPARLLADGALEGRLGDADVGFSLHQIGPGEFEASLGLRHVGDRQFADPEALAGRVELLDQHPDVVAASVGNADVLYQVRIRRDRRKQDGLLRFRQLGALRLDVRLGLLGLGDGLAAAEQRLDHLERRELAVQRVEGRRGSLRVGVLLDLVVFDVQRDTRPPVRNSLRKRLVGLAQNGTACQQIGIAVVGGCKRLDQAL